MHNPVDEYKLQFETACGKAGVFELDIRLLVNKTPNIEAHAYTTTLEQLINLVKDSYKDYVTTQDVELLHHARVLRNKLLHIDFKVLADKTQAGASGALILRLPSNSEDLLDFLHNIDENASSHGLNIRDSELHDAGIFGWLLENGENGAFTSAISIFENAIMLINRLCFVSFD